MRRPDPALTGLVVFGLVCAGWLLAGPAGGTAKSVFSGAAQFVMDLAIVGWSVCVFRTTGLPASTRRFWSAFVFAGLLFAVGDLLQVVTLLAGIEIDSIVLTASWALGGAALIWAMLTHPLHTDGRNRLRIMLDLLTIMTGAAGLSWYFLADSLDRLGWARTAEPALLSAISLVVVYAIARLAYSDRPPLTRDAGIFGGLGAIGYALGIVLVPLTADGFEIGLTVRTVPMAMIAMAALVQYRQASVTPVTRSWTRKSQNRIPYLTMLLTHGLLIVALYTDGEARPMRLWGIVAAMLVSSVLVVGRQLLAFGDNARLVTALDESLAEMSAHERRFRSLVQHASDVTLIINKGVVTYASPASMRVLSRDSDWLLGRHVADFIQHDDLAELYTRMTRENFAPGESFHCVVRGLHGDGSWHWLEAVCTNLHHEPSVRGFVFNSRDITETKLLNDQLRHQASHDSLTGLANRALLDERMEEAAGDGAPLGVLLVDLDGFKAVNDSLGHHAGDALLVAVAERLTACVREGDTVARLGGDEFAVLLPDAAEGDVLALTGRIRESLMTPVRIDGRPVPIRASIGSAIGPGTAFGALLRAADTAMYEAKQRADGHDVGIRAAEVC